MDIEQERIKTRTIGAEVKASNLQMVIKALLGRAVTKAEALEGLQLHTDGDGGNTVGWKFDEMVNIRMECSHKQHTILGDSIIDLGRLAIEYPDLKWCFPESYSSYKKD